MLTDKLLGSGFCVGYDAVCLGLCVRKNCVLVGDDLLITLDLVRCLQPQLPEQLLQFLFVHNDLGRGKRLELTTVNILFDFFNDLLNSAAHTVTILLQNILSLQVKLFPHLFCHIRRDKARDVCAEGGYFLHRCRAQISVFQ